MMDDDSLPPWLRPPEELWAESPTGSTYFATLDDFERRVRSALARDGLSPHHEVFGKLDTPAPGDYDHWPWSHRWYVTVLDVEARVIAVFVEDFGGGVLRLPEARWPVGVIAAVADDLMTPESMADTPGTTMTESAFTRLAQQAWSAARPDTDTTVSEPVPVPIERAGVVPYWLWACLVHDSGRLMAIVEDGAGGVLIMPAREVADRHPYRGPTE
ncbi:hypothetical protein VZC37_22935 [Gordonia sp. LSe1-13]|uniref:Uncharacterized protein n=1 Tax=Gordonia sesuvii TaxID=3116777 RepID=A0ABU7MJB4_9ACTN|nr:hypothetical protein [Gordonia sp. LSe1-13]